MKKHIHYTSKLFLLGLITALFSGKASGQVLWSSAGSTAWFTAGNWTGGVLPGTTQIAAFGVNPTGAATVTITMSSGSTNNGAANEAVGAIHDTTTRTTALTLTNSAASTNGTLTLNGATVSGISNVVLANYAANTSALTLANGTSTMDIAMLTGAKTIITGAGSSSTTPGNTINITSKITGTAALTFLGSGTWNGSTGNLGGILKWGNAGNTFAGGITVGKSDGTQNGILELDNAGALSNTTGNNITVNPYSQLYVATAGTYTVTSDTVFLKGRGNTYATTGPGAMFFNTGSYTWTGPISMSSNAIIAANGTASASVVALQGNILQTGGSNFTTAAGTSSALVGGIINITGIISGSGASDTILGNGTWNGTSGNAGGVVKFGGANTYTGGTIIGKSDGTSNGILEADINTAFNNTTGNDITVNPNSELFLNSTSGDVYTTGNITLNLNGNGNNSTYTNTGGALVSANGKSFTWSGPINLASNARITTVGASTLTCSGNISGVNTLIKNGTLGTSGLILSGTNNTYSGGTQLLAGNITVNSGSSLGTGGLSFLGGVNSITNLVTLNNATQTLTSLTSGFTGTTTITNNLSVASGTVLTLNLASDNTFGSAPGTALNSLISGAGKVVKTGSAKLILTGSGTFLTGGLRIDQGEIRFNPAGALTMAAPDTLNGGSISTVGDTAVTGTNATITLNTLALTSNSTINLETTIVHTLKFSASNGITWTSGKTLIIYGWQGAFNSTTATKGKILVGTTASGLSAGQLAQIFFVDGSSVLHTATILSTGEVVPTSTTVNSIATTTASYGPYCNNVSNGISVAYTASGSFTGVYKVQLSSASGVFTSDTTTGVIGTGSSSPISATIPISTATGSGYRVRVINSIPATYSNNDNGSNITINALPSMGSITGSSSTVIGATTTLTCTPASGTWSSSATGIATVDPSSGVVTGVSAGSCTITYTATNSCGSSIATFAFTVNNASITTTTASYGPYCNTTANTFSVAFTSTGSFSSNFKVQLSNASGTFPSDTSSNIIGLSTTSPISATIPISYATGSGYRIRVINANILTFGTDNGSNIIINALPSMGSVSGASIVDVGSNVTLSCTPSGGTWTSSASGIATVVPSTGVVYGVSAGSATITYTATNSCGSSTATLAMTVNPARSLTTTAASYGPFCNVSGNAISVAFTFTGTLSSLYKVQLSDATGAFTSDTVTNIIGSGTSSPISATIPAATAAGTLYRVRVINGLPSPFYGTDNGSNITIVAPPSMGSITGTTGVNVGATSALSCTPSGGTWSSSASTIATVNSSTGVVTGVSEGTCTMTYTATNTCGSNFSTATVTVGNSDLWISSGGSAWLTGSSWSTGAKPTPVQKAVFSANPTSASTGVGINMNTLSGNEYVGAIYDSARTNNLLIGNSSTTVNGVLHFSGATVNGTSNVVIGHISSTAGTSLTIQNFQGTNGGQTMGLDFGSTPKTIVAGVGTATSFGNTINITSAITDTAALTFLGNGTWNGFTSTGNNGGLLKLGNAANPFFGGITVGASDSTQSGILELDNAGAISNTTGNNIVINPNSQLFLNSAGTYTTGNFNLTLKGRGNNNSTTGLGAMFFSSGAYIWTGPITMSNNAVIAAAGTSTTSAVSLQGNIAQTGVCGFVTAAGTSSSSLGGVINITGVVSGSGASDTVLGNGTWNGTSGNAGGTVKLGNTNTFNGGVIVGRASSPYSSGIFELDVNTAMSNTSGNNITVNPYSELFLNSTSGDTYTTDNITLNLNGTGVNAIGSPIISSSGGALVTGASKSFTWTGPVNLQTDAQISVLNTATLTLTGNISGSGALIKGGNNLNGYLSLTGTSNSWSGGTQLQAGGIVVASGSSLGNGVLSFNPSATAVNPIIIFNNAAQTITSLTSNFPASGSITNTISLASGHVMTFNLGVDATFGSGATNSLFSIITGAGKIVKNGSTKLILGGKNNGGTLFVTGGLRINAGEIRFNPCGAITMTAPDTLNGGTISTVGDTAQTATVDDSLVMGTLALLDNSNINLEPTISHKLKFSASNGITWTSGKTLTITGWKGNFNSTAGTKGRIFVGTTSAGLTAGQLAQISFVDSVSIPHQAILLSTGELVAKSATITTTVASYGPFCAGTSNVISVAYTSTGVFSGLFRVQISDSTGAFTADTTTNIIGTGSSSPISATITSGYGVGSLYRVRVINGSPLIFGSDNGNNISLVALPTPGAITPTAVVIGATATLSSTPAGGTWTSSAPSIASINSSTGVVRGNSAGTCTISYGVTNVCGTGYATVTFTVTNHPVITSLSPTSGKANDTITITGQYFNATAANNKVVFGTTTGNVISATTTSLSVILDSSASYAPVSVLNTGINLFGYSKPFTPTYYNNYFITDSLNFKPKVDFSVGTGPNYAAVGDLDGDGKPDFIAVNTQSGAGTTLTIYRNVTTPGTIGSSSFTSAGTLTSGTGPTNVKIVDLDGDGKPDVVCANTASGSISAFRNISSGIGSISFDAKRDVSTISSGVLGAQPVVIAIGDYDNDGKPDIAVSSAYGSSNTISVIRNTTTAGTAFTGSSFASAITFASATTPLGMCSGDFDGDGLPDIAAVCSTANKVSVFLNTGSVGTISFATSVDLTVGTTPIDIQAGDIDGDGKLDLVVTNAGLSSTNFSVLRNTCTSGSISFASGVNFATGFSPTGVSLGDLNGDGKIDVAITEGGTDTISVFRNTATSGTITSASFAGRVGIKTGSVPTGVNVCDMDGDGYPDLIVANKSGNSISIIRNYPLPKIAPIAGTLSMCASGGTTTLTNDTTGGTWSASNGNATIDAFGVVTGVTAGLDTIYYSIARGGDTNRAAAVVTINPLPTVAAISGPSGVCPGLTATYTDATASGVWAITNTSLATISSGGVVTGITPGNDTVKYTVTSSGCSTTVTMPITINVLPNAGVISGTTTVCAAANTSLSSSGDVGGTWTSSNTAVATVNSSTGVVTGVAFGLAIVTYTVTNGCGSVSDTALITVNPLPNAGVITGLDTVCTGATTTLSDTATGGTWSSSNTSLATVNTSGVVTGIAAGTVTISYTISNTCGTAFATASVTVNTVPAVPASITGGTSVCHSGSSSTLSDATPGGTWSSSNPSLATVNPSTGVVTGVAAGSPIITYTVSNTCGSNYTTVTVNVLTSPTAAITSASAPCSGYAGSVVITGPVGDTVGYKIDGGSVLDGVIGGGGTFTFSTGVISSPHTYTLYDVRNAACTSILAIDTTITPQAMIWVGGTSGSETDWGTATNWSCGVTPAATDDITIHFPTTYYPVVAASASVNARNITLDAGATITIGSSAILNVAGNISNNSTITGAGEVKLNGSSAQTLNGTGTYTNLELNNSAGASAAASSTTVSIQNTLTITSGTFVTNDNLVLASDTTYTGRIAAIPSGGAVSGNVTVQTYMQPNRRAYRFWSHPFSSYIALSQIENYIDVTGVGGAANGFTTTASNAPSAKRYNPLVGNSSAASDPGWLSYTSAYATDDSNRLHQYQGIRLFYRGAKGEGLGYIPYIPGDTTISMVGPVNQGSQTITLLKGSTTLQDYNMVGNPYPSPVDIGTVITNAKIAGNINGNTFYVWNPFLGSAGQYVAVTINTATPVPFYMQACNAFQVRAAHNGDTLHFDESNKAASSTFSLLKAAPEYSTLTIYDANYHPWDMLQFRFSNEATDNEDNDYDGGKPAGGDLSFYSLSAENNKLAVDGRPYKAGKVVPLGITSTYAQDFIIKADNIIVPEGGKLYLHDKLLKQYVLLQQGTEYRFNISADKTSQGENRFELSMNPDVQAVANMKGLHATLTPNPATDEVKINFTSGKLAKTAIRVLDLAGVSVCSNDLGVMQNGTVTVSLSNFASGIYMVEITSGNEKVVQRLIKE